MGLRGREAGKLVREEGENKIPAFMEVASWLG